jgi:hypothetical protein
VNYNDENIDKSNLNEPHTIQKLQPEKFTIIPQTALGFNKIKTMNKKGLQSSINLPTPKILKEKASVLFKNSIDTVETSPITSHLEKRGGKVQLNRQIKLTFHLSKESTLFDLEHYDIPSIPHLEEEADSGNTAPEQKVLNITRTEVEENPRKNEDEILLLLNKESLQSIPPLAQVEEINDQAPQQNAKNMDSRIINNKFEKQLEPTQELQATDSKSKNHFISQKTQELEDILFLQAESCEVDLRNIKGAECPVRNLINDTPANKPMRKISKPKQEIVMAISENEDVWNQDQAPKTQITQKNKLPAEMQELLLPPPKKAEESEPDPRKFKGPECNRTVEAPANKPFMMRKLSFVPDALECQGFGEDPPRSQSFAQPNSKATFMRQSSTRKIKRRLIDETELRILENVKKNYHAEIENDLGEEIKGTQACCSLKTNCSIF